MNTKKLLWIFPLIALIIVTASLWSFYNKDGKSIFVYFSDANQIQVEKTKLIFKGVTAGYVKNISLTEDKKRVLCEIALTKEAGFLANKTSIFYLVKPEIGFAGVKGLDTIIRGTYIVAETEIYQDDEKFQNSFEGQSGPKAIESPENTTVFYLRTKNATSMNLGDPVKYRGVSIGQVSNVSLNRSNDDVRIEIRIQNKFRGYIRAESIFWKNQGVHAKLGLFSSKIDINSFDEILKGGIEFHNPVGTNKNRIAKWGSSFNLHESKPEEIRNITQAEQVQYEKNL